MGFGTLGGGGTTTVNIVNPPSNQLTFVAGENLVLGENVYLNISDNKIYKLDPTNLLHKPYIGIILSSYTAGQTATINLENTVVMNGSWSFPTDKSYDVYIGANGSTVIETNLPIGAKKIFIGNTLASNKILHKPSVRPGDDNLVKTFTVLAADMLVKKKILPLEISFPMTRFDQKIKLVLSFSKLISERCLTLLTTAKRKFSSFVLV